MSNSSENAQTQRGHTLIELLVVVVLLTLIAVIAAPRYNVKPGDLGGSERLLENVASRLNTRRNEAVRIGGESRWTSAAGKSTFQPLPINFSALGTTSSLIIDGDDNNDCLDDYTNEPVTCINGGVWNPAFREDALELPSNWKLAQSQSDLQGVPLIGGGSNGRGRLVCLMGFDATGRILADEGAGYVASPNGALYNGSPEQSGAAFWAVYFIEKDPGRNSRTAVAVALHPSGLIEKFRYDGLTWTGVGNNRSF